MSCASPIQPLKEEDGIREGGCCGRGMVADLLACVAEVLELEMLRKTVRAV